MISLVGFTCLSCGIDDSCNSSLALSIFSPAQATPAHPSPTLVGCHPSHRRFSPFSLFLVSRVGRPVRPRPNRSGRQPVAARRAGQACGRNVNSGGRDKRPTRRSARPINHTVEKALRPRCWGASTCSDVCRQPPGMGQLAGGVVHEERAPESCKIELE